MGPPDVESQRPGLCGGAVIRMRAALSRVETCIPSLRRYAWALLRSRQDADDLVHDTLVRALDRVSGVRDEDDIRAWLFTIMHNQFVSQLRRSRVRRDTRPLDDIAEATVSLPASQEDRLRWRDTLLGLAALPEEQRTAILLISVEGFSYAETAGVLGVPIGTVMSRLSRGRDRLRELTQDGVKASLRRVK